MFSIGNILLFKNVEDNITTDIFYVSIPTESSINIDIVCCHRAINILKTMLRDQFLPLQGISNRDIELWK